MNSEPSGVTTVGVIGGGTSGFFAAMALARRFPGLVVSVIESTSIPIIGVGEATTTLMPPFLHHQLGLDIVELYREVRPTWKLGIKFDWGLPASGLSMGRDPLAILDAPLDDYFFTYPFGPAEPIDAFIHDGHLRDQSLTSMLMTAERTPILRSPEGNLTSLLPQTKHAYHLHNGPFVNYLTRQARARGIEHVDAEILEVRLRPDGQGVESLLTRDGRELRFDLFIDASGFSSILLGAALGSPFHSFQPSLFCDRAIVADVPQQGFISPYTRAETMDAGWCWKIAVEGVDHRGYVHSSAFLSEDAAVAEMRAKNPGMADPWVVRFRSGRHAEFWKGNVFGVGNAYGFVEPLESTALHMVIIELNYVMAALASGALGPVAGEEASRNPARGGLGRDEVNRRVAKHWDFLRWFLAIHYKFNRRLDTPFWKQVRAEADVSGLEDALEDFRVRGPWRSPDGLQFLVGDPAFGYVGLLMMLLGQQVQSPAATPRKSRQEWTESVRKQRLLVAQALPQSEALAALQRHPEFLEEFVNSPRSWCSGSQEVFRISATGESQWPHDPAMPRRQSGPTSRG